MHALTPFPAQSALERRGRARCYADKFGVAVFPVRGKIPLTATWKPYLTAPGDYGTDEEWASATGYAVAPVLNSNLVIIDLDDLTKAETLFHLCPTLRQTFMVTRGTAHLHLYCQLAVGHLSKAYLTRREDNHEVASIRGAGAYVVGPESSHPSGDLYIPNDLPVVTLDLFEQTRLLEWFNASEQPKHGPAIQRAGGQAIRLRRTAQQTEAQRATVERVLRGRGYRQSDNWLNGPCIHPEKHREGDSHPSFGVNIQSGVGHCFVCGNYSPAEVAAALGVPSPTLPECERDRLYAFITAESLPAVSVAEESSVKMSRTAPVAVEDKVQLELNISNALIKRGKHAAARLNDLLFDDSRRHHGQYTYQMAALVELGKSHLLSRTQVVKAVKALCGLGLLVQVKRGLYRRLSVAHSRVILGLGNEYALAEIPRKACMGSVSIADYTAAIVLVVERLLPGNLPSGAIAAAAGISTQSLYTHERRLNVKRKTQAKVVNVATATPHFAKVFDDGHALVGTVSGDNLAHQAMALAARNGGKAWGWRMLPSRRYLPDEWPAPNKIRNCNIGKSQQAEGA